MRIQKRGKIPNALNEVRYSFVFTVPMGLWTIRTVSNCPFNYKAVARHGKTSTSPREYETVGGEFLGV